MLETREFPPTARLTRAMARLARAMLWLIAAMWLLFALSWGALHLLIVPRVDEWRPMLQRLASHALGVQVAIGAVRAESSGPVPGIRLDEVVLMDAEGREALRLPAVQAALSVRSLWRLGFDQLVIDGPVLDIRRTTDGRLLLAGIPLERDDNHGSSGMLDWFFDQSEFAIRGGTLRWTDDQRPHAVPLELDGIALVFRNQGRQHQFRLDASPPPDWGQPFTLQGQFSRPVWQTRAGQWRDWTGTAFASLPGVDAQALGTYVDLEGLLGMALQEGRGSARLWADIQRGQITQITSDLALPEVSLQWKGASGAFALRDFRTRLEVQQRGATTRMATRGLAFVTGEGTPWPGGDLRYEQRLDEAGGLAAVNLAGERLDAQAIRQLAQHLPLPAWATQWLEATQAAGLAETFQLEWQAPTALSEAQWSASGRLRNVSLQADRIPEPVRRPSGSLRYPLARPGVKGLSVDFRVNRSGGQADLSLENGQLVFPGLFEDPTLRFDRLQAGIRWTVSGDRIAVDIPRLTLANADVDGEVTLQWQTADPATSPAQSRFPGVLQLDAQIHRARGDRVVRYLPQDIPASVRRYLTEAISGGEAREGRLRIAGDLWHFPFDEPGTGAFNVSAQLNRVGLSYAPRYLLPPDSLGWPALEVEQARLLIDRTRLLIEDARAAARDWPQLRVSGARAEMADFSSDTPQLVVQGQVRGPAQDALSLIQRSPVRGMTAGVLDRSRASGIAELDLKLDLPLADTRSTRVQGVVRLPGNDLTISPDAPSLLGLQGSIRFTESGFDVPTATARLLGGPVRFSGRMTGETGAPITFQGQGQATVEALSQAPYWPWLAPLGVGASGQAPYQASLTFDRFGTAIQVESNLQGLALQLPPPFDKAAATLLPMRLSIRPIEPGPGARERDEVVFELGAGQIPLLGLHYLREFEPGTTRVLAGSLAVRSERPPMPARGVSAQVHLDTLDVGAWERVGQRMGASGAPPGVDTTQPYWPTELGLSIARLEQGGRVFRQVVAGGVRDRDVWRLSVGAEEASGYVEYRPSTARAPGQLYARLARLDLSSSGVSDVENLLNEQPQQIPAIDLVVEQFRMGGRELGRLEIQAINRQAVLAAQERVREWRLNTLNLTTPEARLQASGNWASSAAGAPDRRRTALRILLDIEDAGLLLERFGMPGVVRGGKGTIQGHIGWVGSPLSFHAPTLAGALSIDVERGQFLKADPGIAKLLGVLSLQSLPRRLALDFRDVFSEGFAFDVVRGNAQISEGLATTNNLQMKGVSAAVLLEGQADIVRETQDITAVVIPELNAGTASLVATVISPVTGLGTFLAQFLLRQPLQEAATRQFRITGPWADPQVERVTRRNPGASESRSSNPTPGASPP